MNDAVSIPPDAAPRTHNLQCMEIWGGHGAAYDAVSAPGIDAWVFSRPYEDGERGGDVHYLSACASGRILRVAVADVAGHGETVSETARALRRLMRKSINTPDQSRLAREVNDAFEGESDSGLFATAILGTYWAPDRAFLFVNAGHPRPLLSRVGEPWVALHADSPHVVRRKGEGGVTNLPLGVIPRTDYEQLCVRLRVGDRLILYTDFAIEARSPAGTELGEDGLLALLNEREHADEDLIPQLMERISAHRGGESPRDDATLVLLRHNNSPIRYGVSERFRTLARLIGLAPV